MANGFDKIKDNEKNIILFIGAVSSAMLESVKLLEKLLAEKTKNKITTEEQNATDKKENKEGKEKYSQEELLNAAEIFCKYNPAEYWNKNPEEQKTAQERALAELKAQHSEREIDAAVKVAAKRNEIFGLKDEIKRVQKV